MASWGKCSGPVCVGCARSPLPDSSGVSWIIAQPTKCTISNFSSGRFPNNWYSQNSAGVHGSIKERAEEQRKNKALDVCCGTVCRSWSPEGERIFPLCHRQRCRVWCVDLVCYPLAGLIAAAMLKLTLLLGLLLSCSLARPVSEIFVAAAAAGTGWAPPLTLCLLQMDRVLKRFARSDSNSDSNSNSNEVTHLFSFFHLHFCSICADGPPTFLNFSSQEAASRPAPFPSCLRNRFNSWGNSSGPSCRLTMVPPPPRQPQLQLPQLQLPQPLPPLLPPLPQLQPKHETCIIQQSAFVD